MDSIIRGTTPTIRYTFDEVSPADITTAIFTIKNSSGEIAVERQLDTATVAEHSIAWTLTQAETLALSGTAKAMLNWVAGTTRGASGELTLMFVSNHVNEEIG